MASGVGRDMVHCTLQGKCYSIYTHRDTNTVLVGVRELNIQLNSNLLFRKTLKHFVTRIFFSKYVSVFKICA